ncbi:MAG TPA: sigma-70 family RNA polymerase sigma factor [Pyrinomonadaceae bacterium]|nr:sigma-70 family RNA polymerase sigma factor [Pyrinomonadaceae bacterium]
MSCSARDMKSEDDEFAELFDEFHPSLCRFLECLLGGARAAAEDIAQESFLRLYRAGTDGPPQAEARFWLFRVARNLALNELSRGHTRRRLLDRVVEMFAPQKKDPEREYEAAERRAVVMEMLKLLPEQQRAALLLREQEEMSYREIAEVLCVSEAKVKVDIFRARERLRERWGRTHSSAAGAANR